MKHQNMASPFSNTKFLKLHAHAVKAEEVLHALDMFPELIHIVIDQGGEEFSFFLDGKADLHKTSFPSPSLLQLKTAVLTWSLHSAAMYQLIEILLENAPVLEKMLLRLRIHGDNPEALILAEEKVLSMPRSSPIAQITIIKDR